ncbi:MULTISPECIES: DinB family protein [unclassified Imperialibacter]|uniref:DinB family protein n=1 Tax=unclassified Imperialibacter TaxID=2629706 RepID=UPI001259F5ED|nr:MULTISPECIES: DinB family protein [unclassified Imperialibacter]CAD5283634.1 DinB family protein [Imperialibacter sp. 89]CAD5285909.1 DinB family protein [Imperialibacter sp. 75]VVT29613.1 DinB superfamily protein [Imperialibacter sp. EC-SDR9]
MTIVDDIEEAIAAGYASFASISDNEWNQKPTAKKWSKKEILGHLIDSAQNNLRRFIVSQHEPDNKIIYHQDEWVLHQNYQSADINELQQLWLLINKQLVRTVRNIPASALKNTCNTGKEAVELHSLEFLIEDYHAHMLHHLKQITARH